MAGNFEEVKETRNPWDKDQTKCRGEKSGVCGVFMIVVPPRKGFMNSCGGGKEWSVSVRLDRLLLI